MADRWWDVHDVIVGGLAGAAAGVIVGLFGLRLIEHPGVPLAFGVVGAGVGIAWLRSSRAENPRFLTAGTVVAWLVLVASVGFLIALARAIATFT